MSWWSRILNVFRADRLSREIDEELQAHLQEALERGRDQAEVRRAFGSALQWGEQSRDIRLAAWLGSLRADLVFAWRQLRKRKAASAAAVVSLALAIGACTAAFRLIDALLLRPLPVTDPERLYAISIDGFDVHGNPSTWDSCSYPMFRRWRAVVKDQADVIAVSFSQRVDLTYGGDGETEKARLQNVSGRMFESFGLRPAAGRLLTDDDDRQPGAHRYAVLSYDYWVRRFGRERSAVGRTFRLGQVIYTIVGVAADGFTGTEPGTVIDIFTPTMMRTGSIDNDNAFWLRTFVRPRAGAAIAPLHDRLYAAYRAFETERAKAFSDAPKAFLERGQKERLRLLPASEGVSGMQRDYRRALAALALLVALVLLIACGNVANLLTAQAAARGREMALRVSIGAGRWRLVQLMLMESTVLASLSAALGAGFAWWAAPFVVSRINPPDNPARLHLPLDWRLLGFGVLLTFLVTLLFGLWPALRGSAVKPASALRGGDDPYLRRRLMHTLIGAQVAFCVLVLFIAGLFVATFERLSKRPVGFLAERILTLGVASSSAEPAGAWDQVEDHLRAVPGVETVALAAWPLLSGTISNNLVSIHGAPPGEVLTFFLKVSPGWLGAMRISLLDGRDFRADDVEPGVAIVNRTFARQYFADANPIGQTFETTYPKRVTLRIVGLAADAAYRDQREAMLPVAYIPFRSSDGRGGAMAVREGTFVVRTSSASPSGLAATLRREVSGARSEFRVSELHTQVEIDERNTIRERLLAMVGLFFALTALLLAGVGLYGVLDYSVLQRRREIGIRMAIGARGREIAIRVTSEALVMVALGAVTGLGAGLVSARYIEALLFQVKATDATMLAAPGLAVVMAAVAASIPAVVRAVRIDPVIMLRSE